MNLFFRTDCLLTQQKLKLELVLAETAQLANIELQSLYSAICCLSTNFILKYFVNCIMDVRVLHTIVCQKLPIVVQI